MSDPQRVSRFRYQPIAKPKFRNFDRNGTDLGIDRLVDGRHASLGDPADDPEAISQRIAVEQLGVWLRPRQEGLREEAAHPLFARDIPQDFRRKLRIVAALRRQPWLALVGWQRPNRLEQVYE